MTVFDRSPMPLVISCTRTIEHRNWFQHAVPTVYRRATMPDTGPITDRMRLIIESDVAEMPDPDSAPEAYEQMVLAVTDAVTEALYSASSTLTPPKYIDI